MDSSTRTHTHPRMTLHATLRHSTQLNPRRHRRPSSSPHGPFPPVPLLSWHPTPQRGLCLPPLLGPSAHTSWCWTASPCPTDATLPPGAQGVDAPSASSGTDPAFFQSDQRSEPPGRGVSHPRVTGGLVTPDNRNHVLSSFARLEGHSGPWGSLGFGKRMTSQVVTPGPCGAVPRAVLGVPPAPRHPAAADSPRLC